MSVLNDKNPIRLGNMYYVRVLSSPEYVPETDNYMEPNDRLTKFIADIDLNSSSKLIHQIQWVIQKELNTIGIIIQQQPVLVQIGDGLLIESDIDTKFSIICLDRPDRYCREIVIYLTLKEAPSLNSVP